MTEGTTRTENREPSHRVIHLPDGTQKIEATETPPKQIRMPSEEEVKE